METARLHDPDAKKGPVYDISKKRQYLLPVYHRLRKVDTTYTVNFGGGGSGKSVATAQSEAKNLFVQKEKLLVIRKFATSLDDSVIAQFVDKALPFWGMKEGRDFKYNKTKRTIKTANGSVVLFRGLDNPEKFKSIEGITRVWIEEATEISEKDFKILDDRIRGTPKILLTYNPISEQHWLKKRFHHAEFPYEKGADDNITVIFSTFKDNPYVGAKYRRAMKWYKKHDPDHYRIYGLGKFGIVRPENPYFTAYKPSNILGECEFDPTYPILYISADFNVKNTFLLSQHFDGERINYFEEVHGGDDLEGLCTQLAIRFKDYRIMFTGDASGNNASAYTTGNMSAWQLIEKYFSAVIPTRQLDFSQVKTSNPGLASSRVTCNALMAHFGKRIQINYQNCPILVDDLQRMMATSDGGLNKTDCNKHNYGHLGDALRYDLCHFEYSTFENLGLAN